MVTDAADLIRHLRAAPAPPDDASVEAVVDLISDASPGAKRVLLEAIGKAMIRAEVARQAKRKAVEKSPA